MDKDDFEKDCPGYDFVPTTLPAMKRVIVIGDIHGDLELAIKSFRLAKLIGPNNTKFTWIANPPDTVVIQVGDQIDSCRPMPGTDCHNNKFGTDKKEDMKVIDFFNLMDKLAKEKGGAVYSLLGNHELMNANNDYRYVSYDNYYGFDYELNGTTYVGKTGRKNAFRPGGEVSKMLGCTRNSVMIIGSNMFIHAGVLPALVDRIDNVNFDSRTKLTYLNQIVRKWLLNKMSEFSKKDVSNKNLIIDNTDSLSPFWTRIYGQIKPDTISKNDYQCENSVGKALKVFKIGKIVVGHTPQLYMHGVGINGTCYEANSDGNLWRVDGGFSRSFGSINMVQVLEIINDTKFNILTDSTVDQSKYNIDNSLYEK